MEHLQHLAQTIMAWSSRLLNPNTEEEIYEIISFMERNGTRGPVETLRLESLDVAGELLVHALLECDALDQVECIYLDNMPSTAALLLDVFASRASSHLKTLYLAGCELTDTHALQIATRPAFRSLERLGLSDNKIGEVGMEALFTRCEGLKVVCLHDNQGSGSGIIRGLLAREGCSPTRYLCVRNTGMPEGSRSLMRSCRKLAGLEVLALESGAEEDWRSS